MKIGNLSEFEPTDVSASQLTTIKNSNFNVVVNKSDEYMMSSDNSVSGSFIDQFADMKIIRDRMTYVLQRFLNHADNPYNQSSIDSLRAKLTIESNKLVNENYFVEAPTIKVPNRKQVPATDVEARTFKDTTVTGKIFNDIHSFNGELDLLA